MSKSTNETQADPKANPQAGDNANPSTDAAASDSSGAAPDKTEKPASAGKAKAEKAVKLSECVVQIERNEVTKIGATVFAHELRVLHAVHGEDRIQVIEEYEVEVSGFKVRDEYERLKRRYNNKLVGDVVAKAYPTYLQLADELGIQPERVEPKTARAASANEGSAKRLKR